MKKVQIVLTIAFLLAVNNIFASTEQSRKIAEEIIQILDMDESFKQIASQVKEAHTQEILKLGLTEEQENLAKEYIDKVSDLFFNEFSWKGMKNEYIEIYVNTFTEEELQQVLDFYKTSVGQKILKRLPEINQKSFEIIQGKIKGVMSKLDQLTDEYKEKIRQLE